MINKYVAKEASATCAAYVAGIVQGFLDAGAFVCDLPLLHARSLFFSCVSFYVMVVVQKVKVTPVRYATDASNTASAKTYIKVQAVDDEDVE